MFPFQLAAQNWQAISVRDVILFPCFSGRKFQRRSLGSADNFLAVSKALETILEFMEQEWQTQDEWECVLLPLFLNKRMILKTQVLSGRSRSALTSLTGKYPSPQMWLTPSCLTSAHDPASLLSARPQDHSSLLPWWLPKTASPHNLQPAPILCQSPIQCPQPWHTCPAPAAVCGSHGLTSGHHVHKCSCHKLPWDIYPTHLRLVLHELYCFPPGLHLKPMSRSCQGPHLHNPSILCQTLHSPSAPQQHSCLPL